MTGEFSIEIRAGTPGMPGFPPGRGRVRSRGAARPQALPESPSARGATRPQGHSTHHAVLYAGLGGASSARSDEQPSAGVDLKRVQRERGSVQLWRPAPTHPARPALHCLRRGTGDMPPGLRLLLRSLLTLVRSPPGGLQTPLTAAGLQKL